MPTPKISRKLEGLRAQIKAGTDALERGDFIEVDDAYLEGYLERLTRPAATRALAEYHGPRRQRFRAGALPEHLEGNADFLRSSTASGLS